MDQFDALLNSSAAPSGSKASGMDRLADRLGTTAGWMFVAAILLSVYEVAMRYGLGAPSSWALPTTTTLCQVGFALGGAYCMARREHIRITFLTDKLGNGRRRIAEIASLTIGAFYLAGLTYATYLDARNSIWKFDFAGAWAPELTPGPPNWPLPSIGKAALVLGAFIFFLVTLSHLVRLVREGSR